MSKSIPLIQCYKDDSGEVTHFVDTFASYHSQKVKPEHIRIIKGDKTAKEIAQDINIYNAKASGKAVGFKRGNQ